MKTSLVTSLVVCALASPALADERIHRASGPAPEPYTTAFSVQLTSLAPTGIG